MSTILFPLPLYFGLISWAGHRTRGENREGIQVLGREFRVQLNRLKVWISKPGVLVERSGVVATLFSTCDVLCES